MSAERPRVSVLVPSYDHEEFVVAAVRSVLDQTGVTVEVVAIDDGSRDGSLARLRTISDPRLHVLAQENRGLSRTLNRGLELARGRWVKMLPSDDLLEPGALARQVAQAEAASAVAVFCLPTVVDVANRPLADPAPQAWFDLEASDTGALLRALIARNPLCAPGALFDRAVALEVGGFDPSLRIAQDYDLWLRLLARGEGRLLPERLVRVRWHGANQSAAVTPASEAERAYVVVGALRRYGLDRLIEHFGPGGRVGLAAALVGSGLREAFPFARALLVAHRAAGGRIPPQASLQPLLSEAPELIRPGAWGGVGDGGGTVGSSAGDERGRGGPGGSRGGDGT